ncbi:squalene--hopene cyclase [Metabacillus fastidiosus]|uniref:squalene--hopene cyclase n=1 Tax=Metabacillus fastidiosus TaxID=1458 RepID=UPI0008260A3E|nr:squalene--hopene cyclase [Metabacillus fastidiosus]MED4463071.1 squalene--hopene cyclase [Metabacillus fastidiosus]
MKQMVEAEINRLVHILIEKQDRDGTWSYPFETGIMTDCYMIILLRTLEINDEDLIFSLAERIMNKQSKNGAWKLFFDGKGDLSLTVGAYYAILYSGYKTKNDPDMLLAKQFIINNGGLKETSMFIKMMLALTGQYKWPRSFLAPIEVILLPNFFDFSIYARANMTPIFVAAHYKFSRKTKRSPDLSDLSILRDEGDWERELKEWRSFLSIIQEGINRLIGYPKELRRQALSRAEQYILQRIEPDGTFYSYFSSTFFMIFALLARGYSNEHPIITHAVAGLKTFKTKINDETHIQYTTATVWNTALISYSLQEAGVSSLSSAIQKANRYLLSRQQHLYGDWAIHNRNVLPGGWGFSNINTINPDIDDTTASLRAVRSLVLNNNTYHQAWDRAVYWIISMQNDDGGWAAFEKNIDKSYLAWLPVEGGGKMLLDPSTADLTGRTLEFFGNFTKLNHHHPFIKHGIKWLIEHQEKDGSWYGRWGICYIYGTWAAVTGLVAVGTERKHSAIQKAVQWLLTIQNEDGGWGESCKSDVNKKYTPLANSTRTHTAWALDTLIAAEKEETPSIRRGIEFLLKTWKQNDWTTSYPKGQGLPGGFYIHYESYEYLFPLLALSHYKKKFY